MVLTEDYQKAVYSPGKNKIVFIKFDKIFQPAKGLPETPKIFYKNVSIYLFDTKSKKLTRIISFGALPYSKTAWS